jgi:ABC-type enterobactin transport system permease subunit
VEQDDQFARNSHIGIVTGLIGGVFFVWLLRRTAAGR